jgi:hypothetical protein
MLWSEDVDRKVVALFLFIDFIDGMRQILVQDGTGCLLVDVAHQHLFTHVT